MRWVGVRYRGVALPQTIELMRAWLDQNGYQCRTVEFAMLRFETLIRVEFAREAEAAEFAEGFGGFVSQDRPPVEHLHHTEDNQLSAEGSQKLTRGYSFT